MRHSWLSTSSECFLKSLRGKSRGIQKTLSLIRAANSHHNVPGMYSSVLVVDTWLIHVHQICSQCWLLGDVPAMFSLYTYHHLPKFQHALWYVFFQIESSVFPWFFWGAGLHHTDHTVPPCPICTSSRSVRLSRGAFSTNIRQQIECLWKAAEWHRTSCFLTCENLPQQWEKTLMTCKYLVHHPKENHKSSKSSSPNVQFFVPRRNCPSAWAAGSACCRVNSASPAEGEKGTLKHSRNWLDQWHSVAIWKKEVVHQKTLS